MRYKTLVVLFVLAFCLIPGCMIIWTDQVFVTTLFKTVDADDLGIIAEPNYTQVGSSRAKTKNDRVKVIVPPYVVETGE